MTLAVAHRGDTLTCRENTLAGLDSAARCGADWVEVDVKLTSDGEPVLLHDFTLDRLWEVPRHISGVSWTELSALTAGHDHRIPRLDDALAWARDRGVPLMLDIPRPEEGRVAVQHVVRAGGLDTVVFAGDPGALVEVRADAPGANIAMSWELSTLPSEELLRAVRPDYFNQWHPLLDGAVVERLGERGIQVCAYTVDDPTRIRELVDMGVRALISNDIRTLVDLVGSRSRDGDAHADRR